MNDADRNAYEGFVKSVRHALQLLRDNYTKEAETQLDASLEHLENLLRRSETMTTPTADKTTNPS